MREIPKTPTFVSKQSTIYLFALSHFPLGSTHVPNFPWKASNSYQQAMNAQETLWKTTSSFTIHERFERAFMKLG